MTTNDIRDEILNAVKREIVGPSNSIHYRDDQTGQEVLLKMVHGSPKQRYGAGMLYPQSAVNKEVFESENGDSAEAVEILTEEVKIDDQYKSVPMVESGSPDEEPVSHANQFFPSAMGFTVRLNLKKKREMLRFRVHSAYYQKSKSRREVLRNTANGIVAVNDNRHGGKLTSDYWLRVPIATDEIILSIEEMMSHVHKILFSKGNKPWLAFRVYNRTRPSEMKDGWGTFSILIINELQGQAGKPPKDDEILFQNGIDLLVDNPDIILPYPERKSFNDTDEEKELNLLYRKKRVYAIGHGSSVVWTTDKAGGKTFVNTISTNVLPQYEMKQVAPTGHVELSMLELSDKGNWNRALESLDRLKTEYEGWISSLEQDLDRPEMNDYRDAAQTNIQKCRITLKRIVKGIDLLKSNDIGSDVVRSFRWMNRAMLWQQQRSKTTQRKWQFKNGNMVLAPLDNEGSQQFLPLEEYSNYEKKKGYWRPFQLAFILMNLESVLNPQSDDREIVDLIWFPTGGGKTEAYLGLSAFNIFFRRLQGGLTNKKFGGTSIIMRYTLRLLTTQQYERASSLISACELIRRDNIVKLGNEPITIGLWVGSGSTPNKNQEASVQYNKLRNFGDAEYNFVVMKCPCCGAAIGKTEPPIQRGMPRLMGLNKDEATGDVYFYCENKHCEFYNERLPLMVVDEQIYDNPPTLLLSTVDKFAMIPWKIESGSLFGFRKENNRLFRVKPPDLIIQDELHLISGPLGTVVGLYETLIQTLCNDYGGFDPPFIPAENNRFTPPKIVASTATISRAGEQIRSLYGTSKFHIFPSQGLEFGDTWFSKEMKVSADYPARRYVGILASGYPSMQTAIVRVYASILQSIKPLSKKPAANYYWTLLGYFNSIRELGGATSLVQSDIRERLGQVHNRDLIFQTNKRYIDYNNIELTSRIKASEIPEALKQLETDFNPEATRSQAMNTCLATNMVATGVDISRLGLMCIHGQPKTTAEYIQASSRVGRDLPKGPGLIFSLYSPNKPRDKSIYEQFHGYHDRIYSNVEPTSVTPFSINARERGLHVVLIGLMRHFSSNGLRFQAQRTAMDFSPASQFARNIILERCHLISHEEYAATKKQIESILAFWETKDFDDYGDAFNWKIRNEPMHFPLMYSPGTESRSDIVPFKNSLPTPTSMRGVDTESRITIMAGNE
jgi:hypothetical protein